MNAKEPVNILLVDDQPAKLLSYEAILRDLGENLIMAGSAREALEHLLKTNIAVILIDVRMPEVDGIETAKRLKKRRPETNVILVTGLDEPQIEQQAREAGAVALLKKGALHDQLKEAIIAAASSQRITAS